MGQCGSGSASRTGTVPYDVEPADTQQYREKKLPTLLFQAALSNIKLTNYPFKKASPMFTISPHLNLPLPAKETFQNDPIVWKINHKFTFEIDEFNLRKSYLEVEVQNQTGKRVASLRVNMFLIATGPFHLNLAVKWGEESGRISFDLKMSQIIKLKVESRSALIELARSHPGEEFSYSIKTIASHNGACTESNPSYPAVVVLDKKGKDGSPTKLVTQSEDLSNLQMCINRKKSLRFAHELDKGQDLRWSIEEGQLPELNTMAVASELHNTFFQILIWRYQTSENDQTKKQIFADTYVSFYKLFSADTTHRHEKNLHSEQRLIKLTEKIEHFGRQYGKGTFEFGITNDVYHRQYQICVRTEMGILKSYPIFGMEEKGDGKGCAQLEELQSIRERVEGGVIKLNDLQTSDGDHFEIRLTKIQLQRDMESMVDILQRTSYSPRLLYKYPSELDLVRGQKALLEVGIQVSEYLQIEDAIINDMCWHILTALTRRSEFSLHHMGFSQTQKQEVRKGYLNKLLESKLKSASQYKSFLYKLLRLCLQALEHKGSEFQMSFAERFSAYAYFRIPQFRKQVLRLITRNTDPDINEWRGVDFSLTDDNREKDHNYANIFSEMFDWEEHFYHCLPSKNMESEEGVALGQVLADQAWKERFSKRGLAFFAFIKYWVSYVETSSDNRDIEWRYFPGFNRILKGFLAQMKLRPLLEYPDALLEASRKLLANPRFLSPFIKVLFNKVSVYDNLAVIKTIEYLNSAFKTLQVTGRSIPINFNYRFFFKGIKMILEAESSMGITALLTLIYNHFQLFHADFVRNLSMYFLGRIFWKLFLNWSFGVRDIFNHLLTFKIYRRSIDFQASKGSSFIEDIDIKERFEAAMSIAEDIYDEYLSEKRLQSNSEQDHLYLRMQKKLQRRRKTQKRVTEIMRDSGKKQTKTIVQGSEHGEKKLFKSRKSIQSKKELVEYSESLPENKKVVSNKENVPSGVRRQYFFGISQGKVEQTYGRFGYQEVIYSKAIPESEFVLEDIPGKLLKYVPVCLPDYRKVKGEFEKALKEGKGAPPLKLEIAFDREEILPDGVDEW